MSDIFERLLIGGIGAATGLAVGYGLGRSTKIFDSVSSSGATAERTNSQMQFIERAAMTVAAMQWAEQMENRKHSFAGQDILKAYEEYGPGRPSPMIVNWVMEQFALWKAEGGWSWVREQVEGGESLKNLAHSWVMTVMGCGVGLEDDFKDFPKAPQSEAPFVKLRYCKKLGVFR